MSTSTFTPDTVLVRTSQLPEAELGPEDTVLLDAEQGVYYGLEGPARVIWDLLKSETSVNGIVDVLVTRYEIDRATCSNETTSFIKDLIENGLVRVR